MTPVAMIENSHICGKCIATRWWGMSEIAHQQPFQFTCQPAVVVSPETTPPHQLMSRAGGTPAHGRFAPAPSRCSTLVMSAFFRFRPVDNAVFSSLTSASQDTLGCPISVVVLLRPSSEELRLWSSPLSSAIARLSASDTTCAGKLAMRATCIPKLRSHDPFSTCGAGSWYR